MISKQEVGLNIMLFGYGAAFLAPLGILAVRSLHWLQFGEWEAWTIAGFLMDSNTPWPTVEWVGVQKIINWVITLSIEWVVFAGALLIGLYGQGLADE